MINEFLRETNIIITQKMKITLIFKKNWNKFRFVSGFSGENQKKENHSFWTLSNYIQSMDSVWIMKYKLLLKTYVCVCVYGECVKVSIFCKNIQFNVINVINKTHMDIIFTFKKIHTKSFLPNKHHSKIFGDKIFSSIQNLPINKLNFQFRLQIDHHHHHHRK